MAPVTAALLKTCTAGRDVQFIVSNKDLLRCDLEKTRHCGHCLTAEIHEGGRNQQAQVMARQSDPAGQTKKPRFRLHRHATRFSEFFNEIGTGIVASAPVFATGVAKSHNELYVRQCACEGLREETIPRYRLLLLRRLQRLLLQAHHPDHQPRRRL